MLRDRETKCAGEGGVDMTSVWAEGLPTQRAEPQRPGAPAKEGLSNVWKGMLVTVSYGWRDLTRAL